MPKSDSRPCRLCCRGVTTLERGQAVTRCVYCGRLLEVERTSEEERQRGQALAGCLTAVGALASVLLVGLIVEAVRKWVIWAR